MRIVSLVPSFTEMLLNFELEKQVVGRTRFCVRPEDKVKKVTIIGGTKNPDVDKIRKLEPDLIIANKEENRKEDIEELQRVSHVHITEIKTVDHALTSIREIGGLVNREKQAAELLDSIKRELENIPPVEPVRAAYLIWRNPWMSAGGDTYINDVLRMWKLQNIYSSERRYPVLTMEKLKHDGPDYILLSSEPFPFKEKHMREVAGICPGSSVVLVDGQWFSWYGSRMTDAFRALNNWRATLPVE